MERYPTDVKSVRFQSQYLACLVILKICDTMKQSVCVWQYIYIYIYILVTQNLKNILVTCWMFWQGPEGDEPHWTVRCQAHLILSKSYSLDLPQWLKICSFSPTQTYLIFKFLQCKQNFLKFWFTVKWSTFIQQIFLVVSVMLRTSLNKLSISSSTRWQCSFICVAFKSYMRWSRIQGASALTTTILSTIASTHNSLNCFSHVFKCCKLISIKTLQNFDSP